ncbi:MAG: ATP-binding cassette domain-containing protein [Coprobacillus sp.]|nr:ATP-binding cassette domain-containing protein [Coprobacillus sp.]
MELIRLTNVKKTYKTGVTAIQGLDLTIDKGQFVFIIGSTGCGKSTLIKMLYREEKPTSGQIIVGGVDVGKLRNGKVYKIRRKIGVVFQDFKIFSFTLKENLAFEMARDISDKEILNILENVELGDRIAEMEKGIYTYLFRNYEYDGIELSGGEMQRIAIARALLKDAPIVIMDEPTSSLDALAEAHIYEYFNKLVEGKTGIYISHRMSSTKFCDKIAYFEEGMIKEFGTLNELMTIRGGFYNMYKLQANYYSS